MGTMRCGGWAFEFDDRLLIHLQLAIIDRLRRGQPVLVNWAARPAIGAGRDSLWIPATAELSFKFNGSRRPTIDPRWVQRLLESASSSTGLIVTDGDGRLTPPTDPARSDHRASPLAPQAAAASVTVSGGPHHR